MSKLCIIFVLPMFNQGSVYLRTLPTNQINYVRNYRKTKQQSDAN